MGNALKNETNENQTLDLCEDSEEDYINVSLPILTEEEAAQADAYMQELFEENYDRIKDIFYHICISDDFQYKILVTRRAYLLYQIFASVFLLCPESRPENNSKFKICGEVCNSHSLDAINTSHVESKNRFLIFDDIIVHGRAIENTVSKLLEKNIVLQNISIWCLLEKEDANCLLEATKNRITVYEICNEEVWKSFSDDLTDVVRRYGKGYTSYVNTYILSAKTGKTSDAFSRIFHFFKKSIACKTREWPSLDTYNTKSFVVFIENDSHKNNQLRDISCVRFYQNKDYLLSIPYLFIPTIAKKDVFPYAFQLLRKYGIERIPKAFFRNNQPKTELSKLFLKWSINAIGNKLIDKILPITGLSIKQTIRRAETFYGVDNSELVEIPNLGTPVTFCDDVDDADIRFCCNALKEALNDICSVQQMDSEMSILEEQELTELIHGAFVSYSYKIKEDDETRSLDKKERHTGIRTTDMIKVCTNFLHTNFPKVLKQELEQEISEQVMALFIQTWDCGTAAYDFAEFEDSNGDIMVSAFIRNGEQVFRALYEYFEDVYKYYYAYTVRTLITDINKLQKFGAYLENVSPENKRGRIRLFNDYLTINSSYYADVYVANPKSSCDEEFTLVDKYLRCEILENL